MIFIKSIQQILKISIIIGLIQPLTLNITPLLIEYEQSHQSKEVIETNQTISEVIMPVTDSLVPETNIKVIKNDSFQDTFTIFGYPTSSYQSFTKRTDYTIIKTNSQNEIIGRVSSVEQAFYQALGVNVPTSGFTLTRIADMDNQGRMYMGFYIDSYISGANAMYQGPGTYMIVFSSDLSQVDEIRYLSNQRYTGDYQIKSNGMQLLGQSNLSSGSIQYSTNGQYFYELKKNGGQTINVFQDEANGLIPKLDSSSVGTTTIDYANEQEIIVLRNDIYDWTNNASNYPRQMSLFKYDWNGQLLAGVSLFNENDFISGVVPTIHLIETNQTHLIYLVRNGNQQWYLSVNINDLTIEARTEKFTSIQLGSTFEMINQAAQVNRAMIFTLQQDSTINIFKDDENQTISIPKGAYLAWIDESFRIIDIVSIFDDVPIYSFNYLSQRDQQSITITGNIKLEETIGTSDMVGHVNDFGDTKYKSFIAKLDIQTDEAPKIAKMEPISINPINKTSQQIDDILLESVIVEDDYTSETTLLSQINQKDKTTTINWQNYQLDLTSPGINQVLYQVQDQSSLLKTNQTTTNRTVYIENYKPYRNGTFIIDGKPLIIELDKLTQFPTDPNQMNPVLNQQTIIEYLGIKAYDKNLYQNQSNQAIQEVQVDLNTYQDLLNIQQGGIYSLKFNAINPNTQNIESFECDVLVIDQDTAFKDIQEVGNTFGKYYFRVEDMMIHERDIDDIVDENDYQDLIKEKGKIEATVISETKETFNDLSMTSNWEDLSHGINFIDIKATNGLKEIGTSDRQAGRQARVIVYNDDDLYDNQHFFSAQLKPLTTSEYQTLLDQSVSITDELNLINGNICYNLENNTYQNVDIEATDLPLAQSGVYNIRMSCGDLSKETKFILTNSNTQIIDNYFVEYNDIKISITDHEQLKALGHQNFSEQIKQMMNLRIININNGQPQNPMINDQQAFQATTIGHQIILASIDDLGITINYDLIDDKTLTSQDLFLRALSFTYQLGDVNESMIESFIKQHSQMQTWSNTANSITTRIFNANQVIPNGPLSTTKIEIQAETDQTQLTQTIFATEVNDDTTLTSKIAIHAKDIELELQQLSDINQLETSIQSQMQLKAWTITDEILPVNTQITDQIIMNTQDLTRLKKPGIYPLELSYQGEVVKTIYVSIIDEYTTIIDDLRIYSPQTTIKIANVEKPPSEIRAWRINNHGQYTETSINTRKVKKAKRGGVYPISVQVEGEATFYYPIIVMDEQTKIDYQQNIGITMNKMNQSMKDIIKSNHVLASIYQWADPKVFELQLENNQEKTLDPIDVTIEYNQLMEGENTILVSYQKNERFIQTSAPLNLEAIPNEVLITSNQAVFSIDEWNQTQDKNQYILDKVNIKTTNVHTNEAVDAIYTLNQNDIKRIHDIGTYQVQLNGDQHHTLNITIIDQYTTQMGNWFIHAKELNLDNKQYQINHKKIDKQIIEQAELFAWNIYEPTKIKPNIQINKQNIHKPGMYLLEANYPSFNSQSLLRIYDKRTVYDSTQMITASDIYQRIGEVDSISQQIQAQYWKLEDNYITQTPIHLDSTNVKNVVGTYPVEISNNNLTTKIHVTIYDDDTIYDDQNDMALYAKDVYLHIDDLKTSVNLEQDLLVLSHAKGWSTDLNQTNGQIETIKPKIKEEVGTYFYTIDYKTQNHVLSKTIKVTIFDDYTKIDRSRQVAIRGEQFVMSIQDFMNVKQTNVFDFLMQNAKIKAWSLQTGLNLELYLNSIERIVYKNPME